MSCLPGMPCFNNQVTYPSNCGIDLCGVFPNSTDLTMYTGPNLPCIGIDTCYCTTDILSAINDKLCPENLTLAFISSLTNNTTIASQFCSIVTGCVPVISCNFNAIVQDITPTTTTTTSTTAIPCYCYTVSVTGGVGECDVTWTNCDGIPDNTTIDPVKVQSISICARQNSVSTQCFNGQVSSITTSGIPCTIDGDCPPPPVPCQCYFLSVPSTGTLPLAYIPCGGGEENSIAPGESAVHCVQTIVDLGDGVADLLGTGCTIDENCPTDVLKEMCFIFSFTSGPTVDPPCNDTILVSSTGSGIYSNKPYYQLDITFTCTTSAGYIIFNPISSVWEFWEDPDPFNPGSGPGPNGILIATLDNQSLPIPKATVLWENVNPGVDLNIEMSSDPADTNNICTLESAELVYDVNTCTSGGTFQIYVFGSAEFSESTPFVGADAIKVNWNGTPVQVGGITSPTGGNVNVTVTNLTTSEIVYSDTYPPNTVLPQFANIFYLTGGNAYAISITEQGCTTTTTTTLSADRLCTINWSTTNLDVTTYANGDPIPEVTDPTEWYNLTTGAWCYYNNDPANGPIYGKLYNWYAVNDPRGLAPAGFHIATVDEWYTMLSCLGIDASMKMREAGTTHWNAPNDGTNSSGFTALGAGFRASTGQFNSINQVAFFWTADPDPFNPTIYAQRFSLGIFDPYVTLQTDAEMQIGMSIRILPTPVIIVPGD